MQHKSTKGDRIFEAMRIPALIFLLVFSFLQAFAAEAHVVTLMSPHTQTQTTVDITPPLNEAEHHVISIVAEDWRQGTRCRVDPETLAWLHDIIKILDTRGEITGIPVVYILSGYRTLATNKKVGGVTHSQHLQCKALDIAVQGVSVQTLKEAAEATQIGGLGYYPHKSFIHIDSGRVRSW